MCLPQSTTQSSFQIDAMSSAADWSGNQNRRLDWLRVPPSQYQLKNPSQLGQKCILSSWGIGLRQVYDTFKI